MRQRRTQCRPRTSLNLRRDERRRRCSEAALCCDHVHRICLQRRSRPRCCGATQPESVHPLLPACCSRGPAARAAAPRSAAFAAGRARPIFQAIGSDRCCWFEPRVRSRRTPGAQPEPNPSARSAAQPHGAPPPRATDSERKPPNRGDVTTRRCSAQTARPPPLSCDVCSALFPLAAPPASTRVLRRPLARGALHDRQHGTERAAVFTALLSQAR